LVQRRTNVTTSAGSSTSDGDDRSRRRDEARATGALQTALYDALRAQAADLASRWKTQAREILLLDAPSADRAGAPDINAAQDLTNALLAAFAVGDEESEAVAVAAGLQFGVEAFARGASLHHTVKAVNVLIAMVMRAIEQGVVDTPPGGGIADGVWLAQRLQGRAGPLSLAAIRGYTQAQADALRDRFRHLRHDLRNPLGTIKSVLALMDDESVPPEARANANFRAMAKRNARSLEEMIAERLGDATLPLPAMVDRDVSVQIVAESVHRGLRREAERRGVAVLIDASELRGRFDVPGLELLLQAVLEAALQESRTGEQLRVSFNETDEGRVAICLSHESNHAPVERRDALDRLAALARNIGASAAFADPIVISLPMHGRDRRTQIVTERQVSGEKVGLSVAETTHNLRSAREDDHGQASVF
jgi:signal transduction histidine kinase